jgi:hypothetical protein
MIQELLGFDNRLHPKYYLDDVWSRERRTRYLLAPRIKWPLSVDKTVWPSIFRYSATIVDPSYPCLGEMINIEPVNTRHSALELWPNLQTMKDCLGKQKGINIAVSLHANKEAFLEEFWSAVLEPKLSMDELPKGWIHLGYDVADRDMISGLSNCSYNADEVISLQETWACRLNEHGLFSKISDATIFREITDKRISSHSPFYVYGLYKECEVV